MILYETFCFIDIDLLIFVWPARKEAASLPGLQLRALSWNSMSFWVWKEPEYF